MDQGPTKNTRRAGERVDLEDVPRAKVEDDQALLERQGRIEGQPQHVRT